MLFRIAMAILKHHGETLTSQPDTLSVMRYLKSCTKVLFDADGLLKVLDILSSNRKEREKFICQEQCTVEKQLA